MNGFKLGQFLAEQSAGIQKNAFGLLAKNMAGLGVGAAAKAPISQATSAATTAVSKGSGGKVFKGLNENFKRMKDTAKDYNPLKPPSTELAKPKLMKPEIKMTAATNKTPTGPMQASVAPLPSPNEKMIV